MHSSFTTVLEKKPKHCKTDFLKLCGTDPSTACKKHSEITSLFERWVITLL